MATALREPYTPSGGRRAEDRRSVIRKFNTLSKISVGSPFKEMHLWEWDFEIDIDETESRKMQ